QTHEVSFGHLQSGHQCFEPKEKTSIQNNQIYMCRILEINVSTTDLQRIRKKKPNSDVVLASLPTCVGLLNVNQAAYHTELVWLGNMLALFVNAAVLLLSFSTYNYNLGQEYGRALNVLIVFIALSGFDVFTAQGFDSWKKVHDGKKCAFLAHIGSDPCSVHNNAMKECQTLLNQPNHIANLKHIRDEVGDAKEQMALVLRFKGSLIVFMHFFLENVRMHTTSFCLSWGSHLGSISSLIDMDILDITEYLGQALQKKTQDITMVGKRLFANVKLLLTVKIWKILREKW
ncbi:hypothetical protein ACJX0J_037160, partial [Zea mays]